MREFVVGMIGAGGIARNSHLKACAALPEVKVLAVADPVLELAQLAAAEFKIPHVFSDYQELLALPEIEAVIIGVPNYLHAPISIAALQAGKHVLCEKPMAINAAAAREMLVAARKSGKLLTIGLQNRFRQDAQHLKAAIDAGDLGELYHSKATWLRRRGVPGKGSWFSQKALSGGGPLIDLGVHMIDLNLWLMGHPRPVSVSGQVYNRLMMTPEISVEGGVSVKRQAGAGQYDVEDTATAFIRFEHGLTMTLDVSWAGHIAERDRISNEFFGTHGGAQLAQILSMARDKDRNDFTIYRQRFGHSINETPQFMGNAPVPTVLQLQSFLAAIEDGTQPLVAPEQALMVMEIIDAIYESASTGREVVLAG